MTPEFRQLSTLYKGVLVGIFFGSPGLVNHFGNSRRGEEQTESRRNGGAGAGEMTLKLPEDGTNAENTGV